MEGNFKVLINFLEHSVHDYLSKCITWYGVAIKILNNIYIQQKNEIFAQHLLASTKHKMNQWINQYIGSLKNILFKEWAFKSISTTEYRYEYIRDSFINGLLIKNIWQHLLDDKK